MDRYIGSDWITSCLAPVVTVAGDLSGRDERRQGSGGYHDGRDSDSEHSSLFRSERWGQKSDER